MKNLYASLCLLIMCLLGSPQTYAKDQQTSMAADPFKDWRSLLNYMNSKGMDTNTISWNLYEPMCLGLRKESGEGAYNKCMYEKARDNSVYNSDKAQCLVHAKAAYPDRLTTETTTEALRETGKDGVIHNFERVVKPMARNELESLRRNAVAECMQNLGWENADDWRMGMRCSH